jgi:hypothetical protein
MTTIPRPGSMTATYPCTYDASLVTEVEYPDSKGTYDVVKLEYALGGRVTRAPWPADARAAWRR